MKRVPEIQIMDEDGTMLDLSDDQRAPHTVTQFFRLNCVERDERLEAYEAWRNNEPAVFGGGAMPIFRVLLVEPYLDIGGAQ